MSATGACIACGSTEQRARFDGLVTQCTTCGLGRTVADGDADETRYDDDYFRGGGYEDYLQPAARRYEAERRVHWLHRYGKPKSLLEVGSAAGFFVEAATTAGIDARGVERAAGAAAYARDQLGVAVDTGPFETVPRDCSYDAVCAFHVLEHVADPPALLAFAAAALTPRGMLLIEVPNVESVAAARLGTAWPSLQPEYHRWHFSEDSLRRLAGAAGFDVVSVEPVATREYVPPRFRRRQGRRQLVAEIRDLRSLRLIGVAGAELLRLTARLTEAA